MRSLRRSCRGVVHPLLVLLVFLSVFFCLVSSLAAAAEVGDDSPGDIANSGESSSEDVGSCSTSDDHRAGEGGDLAKKATVPGWGIAVIIVGCVALIALVVLLIACCCSCAACDRDLDRLPTTYPKKAYYTSSTPALPTPAPKAGDDGASTQSDLYMVLFSPSGNSGYGLGPESSLVQFQAVSTTSASFIRDDVADNGYDSSAPGSPGEPMSRAAARRLMQLSNPDTADPAFGRFVDASHD